MKDSPKERLQQLADEFSACRTLFHAIGDENRQLIFLTLLRHYGGMRVHEIADLVALSRPALSHHLRILKEAGLVDMYKIKTRSYYHVSGERSTWDRLFSMMRHTEAALKEGEEEWKSCKARMLEKEAQKQL